MAEPGSSDLIDRHANADVGTVGFLRLAAGEEGGHGTGMIARAIAIGAGFVSSQAREHAEVVLVFSQLAEERREFIIAADLGWSEVLHVEAIGHIDERHAERSLGDFSGGSHDATGQHAFEEGQGNGGSDSFEQRSAIEHGFHH